jgi:hypothetical protein
MESGIPNVPLLAPALSLPGDSPAESCKSAAENIAAEALREYHLQVTGGMARGQPYYVSLHPSPPNS